MPQKFTGSRLAATVFLAVSVLVLAAVPASAAPRDTTPPSVPQGMAFTGASTTTVGLRWNASTDNRGVAGYSLYRNGLKVGTTTGLAYTYAGLSCGTSYAFALEAFDAAGNASNRAYAAGTTSTSPCPPPPPPSDTTPPSVPQAMAFTGTTQTTVSLSWAASSDNTGVSGYALYRNGVKVGTTASLTNTYSGLACGTSYTLALEAYDAAGNASDRAYATGSTSTAACAVADTQPPSTPAGLVVTGSTAGSLTIGWSASTDNIGVAGYGAYRDAGSATPTTATSYTFSGLACGTSYQLGVDAYDAAANRSGRATVTGTTAACAPVADTQPPTTPAGLVVTGSSATSLTIGWSASTDNTGVAGYGAYRDAAPAGTTTATSYAFSGLACGTSYQLGVDAYDAAANRSGRATVSGTTAACGPTGSATVFVSPAGSDTAACTVAAPCRSFNRAYTVASPGQTVEVAAGSYGTQQVNADATKTSAADVVFAPAAGAAVTLGALNVYAKHFEVRSMTLSEWSLNPGTDDVTLRNLNVRGGIFITGATNVTIAGGSVGPGVDFHPQFAPWPAGSPISNVVIDGVDFHDWTRTSTAVHTECLQIAGGVGITVRNSIFRNCAVMDLSITEYNGSGPPTDYTIENNVFGPSVSGGYYSLQFNSNASALRNILVRNNSSTQEFLIDNAQPTITNVRVVANIAPISPWACSSRVSYARNVWQGATCNATDKNAPSGFRNPAALDYHLNAGSAAINAGDPTNYPAFDMDGQARPMGGAPDAGADETG